jgi:hypothetical protein
MPSPTTCSRLTLLPLRLRGHREQPRQRGSADRRARCADRIRLSNAPSRCGDPQRQGLPAHRSRGDRPVALHLVASPTAAQPGRSAVAAARARLFRGAPDPGRARPDPAVRSGGRPPRTAANGTSVGAGLRMTTVPSCPRPEPTNNATPRRQRRLPLTGCPTCSRPGRWADWDAARAVVELETTQRNGPTAVL